MTHYHQQAIEQSRAPKKLNNMQKNVLRLMEECGGMIDLRLDGWWYVGHIRNKCWNTEYIDALASLGHIEYFSWFEGKPDIARLVKK